MRGSSSDLHITGAEGIYMESELMKAIKNYAKRALTHSKGKPDKIVITLEELKENPLVVKALPVCTLNSTSTAEAKRIVRRILRSLEISMNAIKTGQSVIGSRKPLRGASIVSKDTGIRLEPDRSRGVRVSRIGIGKTFRRHLSARLSRHGINTDTVKEALILATKIASHPDVRAELCISDDPDYTTGYVASKNLGYLRIPNIKSHGSSLGGRVFFVNETTDIKALIEYLELCPVLINGVSEIKKGMVLVNEILDSPYR